MLPLRSSQLTIPGLPTCHSTESTCLDNCRAVPPRPCLGSIAIHDIRCTAITPFIKDCLTEAILIPFVHHAAAVPLDTERIIT
jgi:hypothetical protein